MPPEAYSRVAQDGSRRPRDIWSFGVLVCEVSIPDFFKHIGRNHPEGVHELIRSGQFPEKVAETAYNLSCAGDLRDIAVSCLCLDPELRPAIEDILEKIEEARRELLVDVEIRDFINSEVEKALRALPVGRKRNRPQRSRSVVLSFRF